MVDRVNNSLIHLTRKYSKDIGVLFRIDKCRLQMQISKRDKMVTTVETELKQGNIADVQNTYKYLQIPQANGN